MLFLGFLLCFRPPCARAARERSCWQPTLCLNSCLYSCTCCSVWHWGDRFGASTKPLSFPPSTFNLSQQLKTIISSQLDTRSKFPLIPGTRVKRDKEVPMLHALWKWKNNFDILSSLAHFPLNLQQHMMSLSQILQIIAISKFRITCWHVVCTSLRDQLGLFLTNCANFDFVEELGDVH